MLNDDAFTPFYSNVPELSRIFPNLTPKFPSLPIHGKIVRFLKECYSSPEKGILKVVFTIQNSPFPTHHLRARIVVCKQDTARGSIKDCANKLLIVPVVVLFGKQGF